jgi:Icc-related predicted phosphoesterase
VDVLLTHAPPRGVGDGPDRPHQGFGALNTLVGRLGPAVLLHGHVDPDPRQRGDKHIGGTLVRNVTGRQLLDIEPVTGVVRDLTAGPSAPGRRRAR